MISKQLAFLFCNQSMRKTHLLMLAILLFASLTQAKKCTSLKAVKKKVDAYGQTLCKQSYQAKCGWFTFKMCTFYEEIPCQGGKNETKVVYKVITECCKGYKLDDNNLTCIRNDTEHVTDLTGVSGVSGVTYNTVTDQNTVTQDEDELKKGDPKAGQLIPEDEEDDDGLNISHGAFAAIASAGLLIICITVVIIIHVRKKQLREEKKKQKESGTPMETRQMIHV